MLWKKKNVTPNRVCSISYIHSVSCNKSNYFSGRRYLLSVVIFWVSLLSGLANNQETKSLFSGGGFGNFRTSQYFNTIFIFQYFHYFKVKSIKNYENPIERIFIYLNVYMSMDIQVSVILENVFIWRCVDWKISTLSMFITKLVPGKLRNSKAI